MNIKNSQNLIIPPKSVESLGMLEISSISRGYIVLDAMIKKAQSCILHARPVTPGKFIIVIEGTVAEVEESMSAGEETAGDKLIDRLLLPQAHEQIKPALKGEYLESEIRAIGLIETHTACSVILALDSALKAADVNLWTLHISIGIGGKGYFGITGSLYNIEASINAGVSILKQSNYLVGIEIIPRPHEDFIISIKSIPQVVL